MEQLEKTLSASAARHRPDAETMREFGDFELTERLTEPTRNRIATTLHLGPQTALALQLLADESEALDPPKSELPAMAAPDEGSQKHTLDIATAFVTKILPRLPDFLATRTTYTFNDTAQVFKVNEWPVHAGLHLVGTTSSEITFLADRGVQASTPAQKGKAGLHNAAADGTPGAAPPAAAAHPAPMERGLKSSGEFGLLLGSVFLDTRGHPPVFHHWEQTGAGLVAVYHYSVPKSDSHYTVDYCCEDENLRTRQGGGGGRRGGGGGRGMGSQATGEQIPLHLVPGYHGSLFIDPQSGVVRRLTVQAELGDGTVSRAETIIDYGEVTIGDRRFNCPLRSINVWVGPAEGGQPASELPINVPQSLIPKGTLYVNETNFTEYHRLGSEMRIVSVAETAPAAGKDEAQPAAK